MAKRSSFFIQVLCVFLICFGVHVGYGQSLQLDGVTKAGFKGVSRLDNNGYYVRFLESSGEGKKAINKVHLYILSNDLKVTTDFTVELGRQESIEDLSYNNGRFMFISSSKSFATRSFTVADEEGNVLASKKFEKVKRQLLEKPASIAALPDGDFLVINYIKEKKVGYSIDRYDGELNLKYSSAQIPDKKKLFPVDFLVSGDKLFVLEFVTPDMSDYFEYHIAAFNVADGKEQFKVQIKDPGSEASGFATFLREGSDGSVLTGGMYFNGNKAKSSNSDGFFAASVATDGSASFEFVDWKDVKSDLKDESTAAFWGGKTKTFMQDVVVQADGSFTLIGENYRKGDADLAGEKSKKGFAVAGKAAGIMGGGNDKKETAVTVSDLALMDFDASGKFKEIRKLDEPTSVTIIKDSEDKDDQPYVGQRKGLNLANILNNNGYFPYRFTARKGEAQYMVSVVKYEAISKELLYFTKLNRASLDTVSLEFTNSELKAIQAMKAQVTSKLGALGRLAAKSGKSSGASYQNEFLLRRSHDPYDYRSKSNNTRVIQSNRDGEVIVYDFIPAPVEGKKKGAMAQMGAAMRGNLEVKAIKIPD